jgi:hypothetical protein
VVHCPYLGRSKMKNVIWAWIVAADRKRFLSKGWRT